MTERRACYGTLFPDVMPPVAPGVQAGRVFSFELTSIGLARGERRVDVDLEAWEKCVECPDFDSCYRLSSGKLMLQSAIRDA
jgi:hypothetical protein